LYGSVVKCGVLFEVRTEFLNIIETIFGFKELINGPSCKARDEISHLCKRGAKSIIFYTVIFMFLGRKLEDGRF
jgi:hypothetical protein